MRPPHLTDTPDVTGLVGGRQEANMGKEKNKGGKEARKPKKEVPKTIAAQPSMKNLMAKK